MDILKILRPLPLIKNIIVCVRVLIDSEAVDTILEPSRYNYPLQVTYVLQRPLFSICLSKDSVLLTIVGDVGVILEDELQTTEREIATIVSTGYLSSKTYLRDLKIEVGIQNLETVWYEVPKLYSAMWDISTVSLKDEVAEGKWVVLGLMKTGSLSRPVVAEVVVSLAFLW